MRHLDKLISIDASTSRADIEKLFRRVHPSGRQDPCAPVTATLKGESAEKWRLVVEFDDQGGAAFCEIAQACKDRGDAHDRFHIFERDMGRNAAVDHNRSRKPPIIRTSLPIARSLAWDVWPLHDGRWVQAIISAHDTSARQAEYVSFAVSLHIGADEPDYGPRPGDLSTTKAVGWNDIFWRLVQALPATIVPMETAEMTVPPDREPASTFKVFPDSSPVLDPDIPIARATGENV